MNEDVAARIDRLVEIHGEGGAAPTREDWRKIFALGEKPVFILNLLRFAERAPTEDGEISGAEAYGRYVAGMGASFLRVGGERLFFGRVGSQFGLAFAEEWDAAILTRYPNAEALARMWLDPDFIAAHRHRVDGLARSQVLVFEPEASG